MINDGKVYRKLEDQVAYLTEYLNANAVAAELGIKVLGQYDDVSDIPEGEYNYGDAFMIGTEVPYTMYIWSRAGGNHPEDYWFNVGRFPMPGPQGEPGLGINNIANINIQDYDSINSSYNSDTGITTLSLLTTENVSLQDDTTIENPLSVKVPVHTDGQIAVSDYLDINDNKAISLSLNKNLDTSYVGQKTIYDAVTNFVRGIPVVYGRNVTNTSKINEVNTLPISLGTGNNLVMYAQKMTRAVDYDAANDNTITSTDSRFNTVLGKANQLTGGDNYNANTENIVFGGKNILYNGVQDSSTFGYRNNVYANQAFTAGYKNTNKGSESIVIGNQNNLNGTITIDTTPDPDTGGYDGASSNTKQCAVFGYKNILGTSNQQMLVAGDQNQVGNNSKWGFVAGSHQNIGKDNFCVNAFDYGNTSERYVEDCTMIGYYNHIYGGPDGSNKVYAANMIGHDNNNLDGNGNALSDITLLGAGLKPSQQNCVVVGKYNQPTIYDVFEVGDGMADDNRRNIFAVANDPLDGPVLTLGTVSLTAAQITALKALIS